MFNFNFSQIHDTHIYKHKFFIRSSLGFFWGLVQPPKTKKKHHPQKLHCKNPSRKTGVEHRAGRSAVVSLMTKSCIRCMAACRSIRRRGVAVSMNVIEDLMVWLGFTFCWYLLLGGVSNICYFHPYLGRWSHLTDMFSDGYWLRWRRWNWNMMIKSGGWWQTS